jgi:hypothetical protein
MEGEQNAFHNKKSRCSGSDSSHERDRPPGGEERAAKYHTPKTPLCDEASSTAKKILVRTSYPKVSQFTVTTTWAVVLAWRVKVICPMGTLIRTCCPAGTGKINKFDPRMVSVVVVWLEKYTEALFLGLCVSVSELEEKITCVLSWMIFTCP